MFGLGIQEMIIVSIVLLLVFGAAKLPEVGKGIGLAIRNFQKAVGGGGADKAEKIEKGESKAEDEPGK